MPTHVSVLPASVSFLLCCGALCDAVCNSINGSIVQILKVASCSFIKVLCFPLWNNKSLCVSQWAPNNRQKDATSSHAHTKCTAAGVFLMTPHFVFVITTKFSSENDFPGAPLSSPSGVCSPLSPPFPVYLTLTTIGRKRQKMIFSKRKSLVAGIP